MKLIVYVEKIERNKGVLVDSEYFVSKKRTVSNDYY